MMESARNPAEKEASRPTIKWYYGIVLKEKDGLIKAQQRLLEQQN